jgi:hypothetical protein
MFMLNVCFSTVLFKGGVLKLRLIGAIMTPLKCSDSDLHQKIGIKMSKIHTRYTRQILVFPAEVSSRLCSEFC